MRRDERDMCEPVIMMVATSGTTNALMPCSLTLRDRYDMAVDLPPHGPPVSTTTQIGGPFAPLSSSSSNQPRANEGRQRSDRATSRAARSHHALSVLRIVPIRSRCISCTHATLRNAGCYCAGTNEAQHCSRGADDISSSSRRTSNNTLPQPPFIHFISAIHSHSHAHSHSHRSILQPA